MQPVEPIHTLDLFLPLGRELSALLTSLAPADWHRLTACAPWTVKDVAAHLLGGSLGRLKATDGATTPASHEPLSFDGVLALINRENARWVEAARRISPPLLIEFLAITDLALDAHFRALDPLARAGIAVSWASDDLAPNWFDIAREYTEKWLHQQHIREAVGQPLLTDRVWLHPVLDTFLRGLPRPFRHVAAPDGTAIAVRIEGDSGGDWTLARSNQRWALWAGRTATPACQVQIGEDTAWRLFTKGIGPGQARADVLIRGDAALGETVLDLVAIMA